MSSERSDPPLRLEPRASRILALLLLLVHGAAMVAVAPLDLQPWFKALLVSGVVMNLYIQFNTHVLGRSARSILLLVWEPEGDWTLISAAGEEFKARLLDSSYLLPRIQVLNFRTEHHGRRSFFVMPDSLPPSVQHRLMLRLRLEGSGR